jgi:hypothetical protein
MASLVDRGAIRKKAKKYSAIDSLQQSISLSEKAINLVREAASVSQEAAILLQDAIDLTGSAKFQS